MKQLTTTAVAVVAALVASLPASAQPLGAGGDDYGGGAPGYAGGGPLAPYPRNPSPLGTPPPSYASPPVDDELARSTRRNQLLSQEFERRIFEQAIERLERAQR